VFDPVRTKNEFDKASAGLATLETAASDAADGVPATKRGRHPILSRDDIWNLAVLYRESTGLIPGTGDGSFAKFVVKVLPAQDRYNDDEEKGKRVRGAIKHEERGWCDRRTRKWALTNRRSANGHRRHLRKRKNRENLADSQKFPCIGGLLQRILAVLIAPSQRGDEYYSVEGVEDDYEKLIRSISEEPRKFYLFSKEALEVRDRVMDHLHKLENCDGFSPPLIGAIGKLKGYFFRICLALHLAKLHDPIGADEVWPFPLPEEPGEHLRKLLAIDPSDPAEPIVKSGTHISRQTAEAVERLLREFLLPHIFGLYDVAVNGGQDRDLIRSIGDFILASPKDRLRPSDMTSGVRALRGQPEHKIREGMGRFCAMGWLEPEEDQRLPETSYSLLARFLNWLISRAPFSAIPAEARQSVCIVTLMAPARPLP
jgi:hypothetical protein